MENQKVYGALIICLIIIFCPFVLYSQEYNQLHIGAEVNGDLVYDKVVLHDNDTCSFFLLDRYGNKVTSISEDNGLVLEWNLKFQTTSGKVLKYKLSDIHEDCSVGVRVIPNGFSGIKFMDGYLRAIKTGNYCYTNGEIVCNLTIGHSKYSYVNPIEYDVLPSKPVIEIIDNYIYTDSSGESCPVSIFSINTENFLEGYLFVYDHTLSNIPGTIDYFITERIEPFEQMPIIITVDYLSTENYGFWCEVFNHYGASGCELVYLDWSQSGVTNVMKNKELVLCGKGFCKIISERTMKNICIYDINGRIIFDIKNISQVDVPLNNGIYILQIIDNEGGVTRKKILIK